MLSLGPPDSSLLTGTRASAAAHGLTIENLSRLQIRSRFPVFELPVGWEGVLEQAAGWIDVNAAMHSGLEQASRAGADLRINTRVEEWSATGDKFVVRTSAGTFRAARLIVTAGAWVSRILADLALPLRVLRKFLVWVNPLRDESFPVFASARDFFYGFPNIGGQGVKLAIHYAAAPGADPDEPQPEVSATEVRPVIEAAAELMPSLIGPVPDAFGRVSATRTCFYTMTPDEHFIVDRHPEFRNLVFAAGFSGHGFKFAPAIGEALAELALTGVSEIPIGFLGLSRFQSEQA
jgi:sarcosine oxidase